MNKYHARKTKIDGYTFDSAVEARRYSELKLLEKAGEIREGTIQVHERFNLTVRGMHICVYESDFGFIERDGTRVIEDVKSPATITPVYKLKKALMLACHGIQIRETLGGRK